MLTYPKVWMDDYGFMTIEDDVEGNFITVKPGPPDEKALEFLQELNLWRKSISAALHVPEHLLGPQFSKK